MCCRRHRTSFGCGQELLDKLARRHPLQPFRIVKQREDFSNAPRRKARRRIRLEFFREQRNSTRAATAIHAMVRMATRDFIERAQDDVRTTG